MTASSGVTLGDLIVQALSRNSLSEAFVAGDRRLIYAHVRDLLAQYVAALAHRGVELDGGAGIGIGASFDSPTSK
jgi:fatty-acyl-CoA synthase